jgi:aspartate kinase
VNVSDRGILVRKYGGSSLASIDRIRAVARDLVAQRAQGYRLVVVVSAMGRTTDELAHLARQANPDPPRRELDMLLSVGERITMSLVSMALAAEGCSAISYTGSQVGIITDTSHTDAQIIEVKADRVRASLAAGHVVVVAGFQGVSVDREITTLGRGGSDTTAVALAAALGAERCEMLKDVDGVYTADPHKVSGARRHARLTYDEMRRIAAAGCGVLHARALEYAAAHGVRLVIRSSFQPGPGTVIEGPRLRPPARNQPASAEPESPASPRLSRTPWSPLAIAVAEETSLLEVDGAPGDGGAAWCRAVAAAADGEALLGEWLEQVGGHVRWGAVAAPDVLTRVHAALAPLAEHDAARLLYRRGCACVSIAGAPAAGWAAARGTIGLVLERCGVSDWVLRADGGVLRLLVTASDLPRLLEPLHGELLQA